METNVEEEDTQPLHRSINYQQYYVRTCIGPILPLEILHIIHLWKPASNKSYITRIFILKTMFKISRKNILFILSFMSKIYRFGKSHLCPVSYVRWYKDLFCWCICAFRQSFLWFVVRLEIFAPFGLCTSYCSYCSVFYTLCLT